MTAHLVQAQTQSAQPTPVQQCARQITQAMSKAAEGITVADSATDAERARAIDESFTVRMRAMREAAGRCVASIDAASLAASDLPAYATLQLKAGQADAASRTVRRFTLASATPVADRWTALHEWLSSSLFVERPTSSGPQLVALARLLVAMGDTVATPRTRVDSRVLLTEILRPVDSLQVYHFADQVLDIVHALPPADRDSVLTSVASLVANVGRWTHIDSVPSTGLQFAVRAGTLWPEGVFASRIPGDLDRLTIIGSDASSLSARTWLNVAAGTHFSLPDGKVTLLEFSSWTCHACKFTYRPLDTLYQQLGARGFRMILSVPLAEGTMKGGDPVTGWKQFFVPYAVSYPIALTQAGDHMTSYRIPAWPMFVLIDRHGIVRNVWEGWYGLDVVARQVERLLDEPATTTSNATQPTMTPGAHSYSSSTP
jgi:hypothetical protein